jgi:hypothetical protein
VWVAHLESNGFTVETELVSGDVINAKRALNNLGPELAGCHLADIDGYLVEGHVPAGDIARMVDEKLDIAGLSVPGMPAGAPGMSGAGSFRVLAFDSGGQITQVFARY